jgi:hypothetical protein
MKKLLLATALLALAPAAHAGAFADTLSVCLVKKTSEADKQALVRWIFVALSRHPAVKDLSSVSKEQADKLSHDVATLYQDLLLVRCKDETQDALKNEGTSAIEAGFNTLGQTAARGLMSHEQVAGYMGEMEKQLDLSALDAVAPAKPAKP